eukprot:gene11278-15130_t
MNSSLGLCINALVVSSNSNRFNINEVQSTLESISYKIQSKKMPIFEFGRQIGDMIHSIQVYKSSNGIDILEVETLFNSYLDALRDFYFEKFINSLQINNTLDTMKKRKEWIAKECTAAMNAALPLNAPQHWNYQGQLVELEADIDVHISDCIEQMNCKENLKIESQAQQKRRLIIRRLKWLGAQVLLFSFNFCQHEVHRRMSLRAAEKRLAEVPEFPLL